MQTPVGMQPQRVCVRRSQKMDRDRWFRGLKVAGGFLLVALGLVMLVTPGPGFIALAGGIGLLSAEFVWAKRVRDRLEQIAEGWRLKAKKS
jgi:hypothetical protein